jgi:hypothetical protein
MAAGDSIVGICNLALVQGLGQDPISALSENRKAAILCNLNYDQVRRALLRSHPVEFRDPQTREQISPPRPPRLPSVSPMPLPCRPISSGWCRRRARQQPGDMEDRKGRQLLSDDRRRWT